MQKKDHFNYKKILEVEDNKTFEEKRDELLGKLRQGIPIKIGKEDLLLKSNDYQLQNNKLMRVEVKSESGSQVAWVEAEYNHDQPKAQRLSKHYNDNTHRDLKGKGLITTCTSLLFQELEAKQVKYVEGRIEVNNRASLHTRFKTEDIIRGGFYQIELLRLTKDVPAYRRSEKEFYLVRSILSPNTRRKTPFTLDEWRDSNS